MERRFLASRLSAGVKRDTVNRTSRPADRATPHGSPHRLSRTFERAAMGRFEDKAGDSALSIDRVDEAGDFSLYEVES